MTQHEAMAIMASGRSVLLTGAAGTGKTYTLNQYIRYARSTGKSVAVTATTGLAATHLNGITIHSWAGIGIHDTLPKNYLQKTSKQRLDSIANTNILIIDEISMLHDFRLDVIDAACKLARNSKEPFGGLQVILCGDFFQLPPVNKEDARQGSFVTNSAAWLAGNFAVCYLHEQFRQKDDDVYTGILNGIRMGKLSQRQIAYLSERLSATADSQANVTKLLTTNVNVDGINAIELRKLTTNERTYTMVTSGSKKYVEQLLKSCLAPQELTLKVNALVMCIKNSPDKRYVNGSIGVVESFDTDTTFPVVRLRNGKTVLIKPDTWELVDGEKVRASASQLPLRLAWAITVHKSQGMTLDAAHIDLSNAFVEGMGYVALSRVKNLDSLYLYGINAKALMVSAEAKQIDADLQARSEQARVDHSQDIASFELPKIITLNKNTTTKKPKTGWSEKIQKMRQEYPNAFKPWSEKDDKALVTDFSDGKTVEQLSSQLGRHVGSIKARLQKHLGDDIFE